MISLPEVTNPANRSLENQNEVSTAASNSPVGRAATRIVLPLVCLGASVTGAVVTSAYKNEYASTSDSSRYVIDRVVVLGLGFLTTICSLATLVTAINPDFIRDLENERQPSSHTVATDVDDISLSSFGSDPGRSSDRSFSV